jgi:hypothetical protein
MYSAVSDSLWSSHFCFQRFSVCTDVLHAHGAAVLSSYLNDSQKRRAGVGALALLLIFSLKAERVSA